MQSAQPAPQGAVWLQEAVRQHAGRPHGRLCLQAPPHQGRGQAQLPDGRLRLSGRLVSWPVSRPVARSHPPPVSVLPERASLRTVQRQQKDQQ